MAVFTNVATLTYGDNTTTSNIVTGELMEVLSGTKTAVVDSYSAGDTVTYVITLRNSGTVPLTGIVIKDNLGAYSYGTETLYPLSYTGGSVHYYSNGVLQPVPLITSDAPLEISGITVPAGGNVTLIYETEVTSYAPLDLESVITNEAEISGGGTAPLILTASVTAAPQAQLTISKSICPSVVTENGQLTYTFVIANSGNLPADEAEAVVLTDVFQPVLTAVTVTFNGETWAEGTNYSYNEATGEFATIAGQITVPEASYTRTENGAWVVNPGVSTLVITGTV